LADQLFFGVGVGAVAGLVGATRTLGALGSVRDCGVFKADFVSVRPFWGIELSCNQ
jgi:hypothetical protein